MKNFGPILSYTAFIVLVSSVFGYPNAIPLGLIYRVGVEMDGKDGADVAIARHNRNRTRVLFEVNTEEGKILHGDASNILKTIKLTCHLLRRGFFILLATGDFDSHPAYSALSDELHIPFINWAVPVRNESGQFEVSIYPPLEEAIAAIIMEKKWTDYNYVYSEKDGPLRSILIDQYVQEKGNRPSRVLLEELPGPSDNFNLTDYFKNLSDRTGRSRTIIDSKGERLREIMEALKKVTENMTNAHFIIASYEVKETELDAFKSGKINVTILNIFRSGSRAFRNFENAWEKANSTPLFDGRLKPVSLMSALAYDSVFVAAAALSNVLLKEDADAFRYNFRNKEFYNGMHSNEFYRGIWCDVTKDKENPNRKSPDRFEHGMRIAQRLRKVELEGVTGHIEFDETTGRRKNYFVEINEVEFNNDILSVTHTVWKHPVGILSEQARVSYRRTKDESDLLPKKKYIIITVLREPFVMKKSLKNSSDDDYEGFCVDLMKTLSTKIDNFDYEIREAPYGKFGARLGNGTWDGMIGELLTGRADMAIAPLTITKAREAVVDFSKPFLVTGLSIMIKRPEAQELSVFSFMQPLSIEVWMYIIFAYLGISVVIFLVSRFSPYEWRVEETTQGTFTISNDFSVYNCLWFTLAAFMQQGIDILPRSVSGRIASSAWWFFTMIIVSSYTANLAAFLTLEKMNAPIESAEDLAKQTKIKYGIQRSGSSAEFFSNSSVQVYQRMWQYMTSQVPDVFEDNYDDGIQRVRGSGGRYAFILEETNSEFVNNRKPCDTMKVGSNLNSIGFGVATPFGSPLKSRVNLAILELQEIGELGNLYHRWWVKNNEGQCPQGPQETGNSLTQNKVAGIFYILIGGMVISLIAAFLEFLYRSRLEAQKSQKTMRSSMKAQLAMTVKGEKDRRMVQVQSPDSSDFPWNN